MGAKLTHGPQSFLRVLGSLWFAVVLLVLLLVAMACATVFESRNGTDMALGVFYRSRWFEGLMALLAANVLAAVVVRYPFSKKQIGFALTHLSILVTLAGALVTAKYGIDGQVGVVEGETVREFSIPQPTLTLENSGDASHRTIDLTSRAFGGFDAVDNPDAPILVDGDLKVEIVRYLPHSVVSMQVVDDNPRPSPAVQVSFAAPGHHHPTWLFANRPTVIDSLEVSFREVSDEEQLARLLSDEPVEDGATDGVVKVAFGGMSYDIPLSDCLDAAVPLGDLSYTVRVLRYMPHANVGPDNKLANASNQPINPAIEVELTGPEGTETHLAFAKFPDFSSMHGEKKTEGFKITFTAPQSHTPTIPVEVLSAPGGEMYVRFSRDGAGVSSQKLSVGTPVESPWPGRQFTVLQRFDHARTERLVMQDDPPKNGRTPALKLRLSTTEHTNEMWVQQFRPTPVTVDGTVYDLVYANKMVPLGFALTLNDFEVGYYPGGRRPRSFESHVTLDDPTSGGSFSRVISMNNPAKCGGYTLYQSRYREEPGSAAVSFLSVSRDPGQRIVFAGYIGLMIGMVVVLCTRIAEHRRIAGRGGPQGLGIEIAAPASRRPAAHIVVVGVAEGGMGDR